MKNQETYHHRLEILEANGMYDMDTVTTSEKMSSRQIIEKYLKIRKKQYSKGFKTAMPKSVKLSETKPICS